MLAELPLRPPFAEVNIGPHQVALLRDGAQAYPAMLEAIAHARSTICLETYILRGDHTGQRFAAALAERARAGVEVNLTFDAWGSQVEERFLNELRCAGVRLLSFGKVRFSGRLGELWSHLFRRNHRKILVVDGETAFTGGLNVADDYAAEEDGGRGWRDTHLRLRGPAAAELERVFLETWRRYGGAPLEEARYLRPAHPADMRVRIVANGFRLDRKSIRKAYLTAIARAQRRLHLTHAYFVPPAKVLRALAKAARRGVDVSVILAATTDVALTYLAARGLYGKLLRAGVRVFEWKGRVLHAKTAVVDGAWGTVGSANLDALSLRRNLEVNAVFEDPQLCQAMESMFNQDLYQCEQVTLEQWNQRPLWERFLSWVSYQFRNWL